MKKTILIAVLAAIMLLVGCAQEMQEIPELLVPVGASLDRAQVVRGDIEEITVYSAAVAPRYTALYFTEDTQIGSVGFPFGSEVSEGDVLVSMDVSSVKQRIAALDSEAEALSAESELAEQLHEIDSELYRLNMLKAATEDEKYDIETEMLLYDLEYENAAATRAERLEAIAAERAGLEDQLAGRQLTSPSNGHLAYLGCAPGQTVGAYDTVCVVTDINSAVIQSDFISSTELTDAAEIYALVGDARYEISPEPVDEDDYAIAVLRGGRYLSTFTVEDPDELTVGESAAVCVVNLRRTDVLKIPVNSLFSENGEEYVYIVEGESRVRRDVSVGDRSSTEVEILSGLEEGEVVYVGD